MHSRSRSARRISLIVSLASAIALFAFIPASAGAAPEDVVAPGGVFSAGGIQGVSGTNCSILGGSYSETMVQAFPSYGGSSGVVRVNDGYWAEITISVPGNQCPHGSDIIYTDLVMPPGTSYDSSRGIRCFSTGRFSDTWYDSTNEGWDMRPIGINAYGRTCPTTATPSGTGNGVGFGYRGLANGQMFKMFVPVKSTQQLVGSGNSSHKFTWYVTPTGSYGTFTTAVWAWVFNSSNAGTTPSVFFSREPSAVPFWKANPTPPGTENRVEFFADLYSAGYAGSFCFYVYNGTQAAPGSEIFNCTDLGADWNASVPASAAALLHVYATGGLAGPNGGLAPFAFNPPLYGKPFTIKWEFTYNGSQKVSGWVDFKSLSGPDEDGDGVANDGTDQCPTQASTNANGCPTSLSSADPDGDGLVGAKDKCPTFAMIGSADGCPTLAAAIGKLPKFKRSKLGKGVSFPVTCSLDTPVKADLTVAPAVAKKLKLKIKKGAKSVSIGSAKGSCKATGGTKLKLKLSSKAKKPVARSKKSISAKINVTFSPGGGVAPVSASKAVKLG